MTTRCSHKTVEPVEIPDGFGGVEVLSQMCTRCLVTLPYSWGCPDCSWTPLKVMSGATVGYAPDRLCEVHA